MKPLRALLWLGWLWAGLAAASLIWSAVQPAWALGASLLLIVAGFDLWRLYRPGEVHIERRGPHTLAIGTWQTFDVTVVNRGDARIDARLLEHLPVSFEAPAHLFPLALEPGELVELAYRVRPTRRGQYAIERAELALRSPFHLWERSIRLETRTELRVFPNFREVSKYAFLATENRTSVLGIRRRPRRGEGLDFHQLREYRPGDSLRQIDWKATSRLQKTISREYQDERDQQVFFLLDCGVKMHARDADLSHFDHALNALLLLSHVALRQGDAVGLMTFSGEARWLAPRKGSGQLRSIMRSVYDLETTLRPSDYLRAAQSLMLRLPKRALVVVVSNLRDEDHDELIEAARLLGRKHLVLAASMKERALAAALESDVRELEDALRVSATHQYLEARARAHHSVTGAGVLALDAEPDALAVQLVNGYLDVKASGAL